MAFREESIYPPYVFLSVFCWCILAVMQLSAFIRRLHDMNKSGWLWLFCVFGLPFYIIIGIPKGTQGAN